jgi:hypothetical protein
MNSTQPWWLGGRACAQMQVGRHDSASVGSNSAWGMVIYLDLSS